MSTDLILHKISFSSSISLHIFYFYPRLVGGIFRPNSNTPRTTMSPQNSYHHYSTIHPSENIQLNMRWLYFFIYMKRLLSRQPLLHLGPNLYTPTPFWITFRGKKMFVWRKIICEEDNLTHFWWMKNKNSFTLVLRYENIFVKWFFFATENMHVSGIPR